MKQIMKQIGDIPFFSPLNVDKGAAWATGGLALICKHVQ
jgi:hypothetical protein